MSKRLPKRGVLVGKIKERGKKEKSREKERCSFLSISYLIPASITFLNLNKILYISYPYIPEALESFLFVLQAVCLPFVAHDPEGRSLGM